MAHEGRCIFRHEQTVLSFSLAGIDTNGVRSPGGPHHYYDIVTISSAQIVYISLPVFLTSQCLPTNRPHHDARPTSHTSMRLYRILDADSTSKLHSEDIMGIG